MSIIYFKILWQNKTSNPTNSRIFTTAVFVSDGKFQSTSCVSAFEFPCSGKGEAYTAKDKLTLTGLFSSPLEGRPKRTCRGGGGGCPQSPARQSGAWLRQLDPDKSDPSLLRSQERGAPSGAKPVTYRTPGRTHPALSFISANGISRSMTSHKHQP